MSRWSSGYAAYEQFVVLSRRDTVVSSRYCWVGIAVAIICCATSSDVWTVVAVIKASGSSNIRIRRLLLVVAGGLRRPLLVGAGVIILPVLVVRHTDKQLRLFTA